MGERKAVDRLKRALLRRTSLVVWSAGLVGVLLLARVKPEFVPTWYKILVIILVLVACTLITVWPPERAPSGIAPSSRPTDHPTQDVFSDLVGQTLSSKELPTKSAQPGDSVGTNPPRPQGPRWIGPEVLIERNTQVHEFHITASNRAQTDAPSKQMQELDTVLREAASTLGRINFTEQDADDYLRAKVDGKDEAARIACVEASAITAKGQPPDPWEYRVWFGTDRRPNREDDYGYGFGAEYSTGLHCGSVVVHVPKSHELGSLGSPLIARIYRRATGQKADEPLKVVAIEPGSPQSVAADIQFCLKALRSDEREVLLFVHGYNVTFESAALRAAQIGRDLFLPGPVAFYSWPSEAHTLRYTADEAMIGITVPKFVAFLQMLLDIPDVQAVNIIAHSMGNRLLHRACLDIGHVITGDRLGHLVLAASDIPREQIRVTCHKLPQERIEGRRRTTIYWSETDRALTLSRRLHNDIRLGAAGAAIPGTDSIKWIGERFRLDWLGHGYFAEAAPVVKDMRGLLREHKPPQNRPSLVPRPTDVPQYWELRG
jgi:esterase/lipase superfamily enzyme